MSTNPEARGATLDYSPEELLAVDVSGSISVRYTEILRKGSVNIQPEDWLVIAGAVRQEVADGADGVVVLHGTDTMAYSAAALSFLLGDGLGVPVVFTGSMRPGGAPDSDAAKNTTRAMYVAASDIGEVCVVFSADGAGSKGVVLRGSRVRKAHSSALNAFESPSHPRLGEIVGSTVSLNACSRRRNHKRLPEPSQTLDPNVCLLTYHPGMAPVFVAQALAAANGAVIVGTGAGHLATDGDLLDVISSVDTPTVLISGCWQGRVVLGSYALDQKLLSIDQLIPGHDLTPEAAIVKLMWALPQYGNLRDLRAAIQSDLFGELTGEDLK